MYLSEFLSRPDLRIWGMPIAYSNDGGRKYALRELFSSKPGIKEPEQLTLDEWRELVLDQMCLNAKAEAETPSSGRYQFICPAGSVVGAAQAIRELNAGSQVGIDIVEIKREFLIDLIREVYTSDNEEL